ncbi:hypothetical protein TrVE_jg1094 [Triparma verrucosa]|uniref:Protein kinase domain-containing protein n=1 Tax=Triparma verrucosa TaxID=1606542 RepID=A0A9W7F9F1_9STRA|nr:hypothetical protein TrVE_jg1094 [Triparma verrucosa]
MATEFEPPTPRAHSPHPPTSSPHPPTSNSKPYSKSTPNANAGPAKSQGGWSIGTCTSSLMEVGGGGHGGQQGGQAVSSVLAATCDSVGFDIAEVWLRTGPKTHQLTHSHLRPHSLKSHLTQLTEVYYGPSSSLRTHRLSPALCKRAKDSADIVWLTSTSSSDELSCAISDIKTAVACPVCNESLGVSVTVIFFALKGLVMDRSIVEFVFHMSLATGVASRGWEGEREEERKEMGRPFEMGAEKRLGTLDEGNGSEKQSSSLSKSLSSGHSNNPVDPKAGLGSPSSPLPSPRSAPSPSLPSTPPLDVKWSSLRNVEYLTDGGNTWIHTATHNSTTVVVKTLKPECQDVALAINEIEGELNVHRRLRHTSIVGFIGAGLTAKGMRFLVLERLDGGTLTQVLGYDTRIRDRRRRFWKRRQMSYSEVLKHATALSSAMNYLHSKAIEGCMIMHRDLKPDNIGFTLDGSLKLIDFGLAKVIEGSDPTADDVYRMSGETGSLRYMAPEVADNKPYNHKSDVYSFGVILWEMTSYKKPYEGFSREAFYRRVVKGKERPVVSKKWPKELGKLMGECWDEDVKKRPNFEEVERRLREMGEVVKQGEKGKGKGIMGGLIDRHSTWF